MIRAQITSILLFLFIFLPVHALQFSGALTQGGHAFARVKPNTEVIFAGETVPVTSSGWFGIGFHRNHPPEANVTIKNRTTGTTTTHSLIISPRTYKTQNIQGVKQETVTPNKTQNIRAANDSKKIKAARQIISDQQNFLTQFIQPTTGRETGVYGSRRTYNGIERSWHKGYDLAAPTGTPIVAPTNATVVFAADTFYNGNLIILDHGNQFFSIYAHLDSMAVKVGETVAQQQKIGEVGTTGRSTGPHLHWGFYWKNIALDPKLLLSATTDMMP